jgi:hypothetical protein
LQPTPASFGPFTPNPEDGAQIETWFQELDTDYDGFIGGAEVVPFFQRSNLNKPILRELWNLVDYNKNGRLDRKQFIIAIRMLAVLCSPIYAGSSPTADLFNSTRNKPISLPSQMYQSTPVVLSVTPAVATSAPSRDVNDLLHISSIPDAELPPLQASPPAPLSHQPSVSGLPSHTAGIYPHNVTSVSAVDRFPLVQSGYPGAPQLANYSVPMPPPVTVNDEDEFSDFNAAPVTVTVTVTTNTSVPSTVPIPSAVTKPSLVVDKEEPWEFVSAQSASQGSTLSVPIATPAPSTAMTTAQSTNISMLSFDLDDILGTSAPTVSTASKSEMPAPTPTTNFHITHDVKDDDGGMDFEDFQQAQSAVPAAIHSVVVNSVTNATASASSASRLAILDEMIEQDLKMAAEEDWEDFEGAQQTVTMESSTANRVEVQSIEVCTSQPVVVEVTVVPTQVSDNPFDLFDVIDTPQITTLESDNPFSDTVESSAVAPAVTIVAPTIVSVTVEDGDDDDDNDFGDFTSSDHSPVPSMRVDVTLELESSSVAEAVTAVSVSEPPKEDDPFAELELQSSLEPGSLPTEMATNDLSMAIDSSLSVQVVASEEKPHKEKNEDPFVEANIQSSEHSDIVINIEETEISPDPSQTLPPTNTNTMTRQAASLDFLDLDFGPVADSAPLPILNVPSSLPSNGTNATTMASSNKKVDLLDLLENVYGASTSSAHTLPTSTSLASNFNDDDFHPFVGNTVEVAHAHVTTSSVLFGDDTNQRVGNGDDEDDFEPFQSTPAPPVTTIKTNDGASSSSILMATDNHVTDFDPFVTGGPVEDDDFFVEATPIAVAPASSSKSSTLEIHYKTALTTSDLESLAQQLAKKHLYDEAYACAKQASVLRTIASLSEAKNLALEQDDLDTAQSIKKETQLWTQQLVEPAMERHWQHMAHDIKRQGASIDEMYENVTFMDETLARKFHQKYFNASTTASSSSSSAQNHDIGNVDGTKYYRPSPNNTNISMELRMKYHVLVKRSARMIMAITSSHRQHVPAWKHCLEILQKLLTEQDRHWTTTFGKKSALSATDKRALANSSEARRKYLDPLIASCEMALWMSATCQESLVYEEEARRLWRLSQPLLLEIDETLHLQNKYSRISLEEMSIAAGEMSECTGQVTYCNFSLRPLRHRFADDTTTERILYTHERRDTATDISYALPLWNLWMARKQSPVPASDGLFM